MLEAADGGGRKARKRVVRPASRFVRGNCRGRERVSIKLGRKIARA